MYIPRDVYKVVMSTQGSARSGCCQLPVQLVAPGCGCVERRQQGARHEAREGCCCLAPCCPRPCRTLHPAHATHVLACPDCTAAEYKTETFSGVYKKLTGQDVAFEFPVQEQQ